MSWFVPFSPVFLMHPTLTFDKKRIQKVSRWKAIWPLGPTAGAYNNRCFRCPHSEAGYFSLPYSRRSSLVRTSGESWDRKHRLWEVIQSSKANPWGLVRKPSTAIRKIFFLKQWLAWLGTEECTCAVLGNGDEVRWAEVIPLDCISSGLRDEPSVAHQSGTAEWYQPW